MSTDRPATITTVQMTHLHALLRDHGITGEQGPHDWIAAWYAENEPEATVPESRRDLPTVHAARMIRDLETAEVATAPVANRRGLARLRAKFEDDAIGKLPRSTCRDCSRDQRKRCDRHNWVSGCPVCRGSHTSAAIHIDYVGHADVTARLLEVDPTWTWEPMALDPTSGLPILTRDGGLWIRLTVLGVTRPGYGDVTGTGGVKEAIGDALRNAAMRFGVALDLWAKGDREWAHAEKDDATTTHPDQAPPRESTPPEYRGPTVPTMLRMLEEDAARAGITMQQITAKLRQQIQSDGDWNREVTVEDLLNVDPEVIWPFQRAVREYTDQQTAKAAAEVEAAKAQAQADDPWAVPGTDITPADQTQEATRA